MKKRICKTKEADLSLKYIISWPDYDPIYMYKKEILEFQSKVPDSDKKEWLLQL